MKRLAGYTAVILATCTLLAAFWKFRTVAALFFFSVFVAAAVRPLIGRLVHFKIPRPAAQGIVFGGSFAIFGVLLAAINTRIASELIELTTKLQGKYWVLYLDWLQGSPTQQALISQVPPPLSLWGTPATDGSWLFTLFNITQNMAGIAGGIVLIIILSIYWSGDQAHFERLWLSLLPPEKRSRATLIWRDIEETIGRYILNEVAQSLFAFALLGAVFSLTGIDYGLTEALIVALLLLVPLVGEFLAVLATLLIGLLSDPVTALVGSALTLAILLIYRFSVERRWSQQRGSSGLITILTAVFFVSAIGLWGLILAPPFAMAAQLLVFRLVDRVNLAENRPRVDAVDHLETRLGEAMTVFDQDGDGKLYPPEIRSIIERLDQLLGETAELERLGVD